MMSFHTDETYGGFEAEQHRREALRHLRQHQRRRQLMWWLTLLGLAATMVLSAAVSQSLGADPTALAQRLRELETRVAQLEEDRERLARALLTFEVPSSFSFAGEGVPLDRWDVHERLEREVLLSL